MVCKGKGENKEYCDKVIQDILEHWNESVYGKTTKQKGDEDNEAD